MNEANGYLDTSAVLIRPPGCGCCSPPSAVFREQEQGGVFSWVCFRMCKRNVTGYPSYQLSGEKRRALCVVFPSAGCSQEKVPRCDGDRPDPLRARPSAPYGRAAPRQQVSSASGRCRAAFRRCQQRAFSGGAFGACCASAGLLRRSARLGSCSLVCCWCPPQPCWPLKPKGLLSRSLPEGSAASPGRFSAETAPRGSRVGAGGAVKLAVPAGSGLGAPGVSGGGQTVAGSGLRVGVRLPSGSAAERLVLVLGGSRCAPNPSVLSPRCGARTGRSRVVFAPGA